MSEFISDSNREPQPSTESDAIYAKFLQFEAAGTAMFDSGEPGPYVQISFDEYVQGYRTHIRKTLDERNIPNSKEEELTKKLEYFDFVVRHEQWDAGGTEGDLGAVLMSMNRYDQHPEKHDEIMTALESGLVPDEKFRIEVQDSNDKHVPDIGKYLLPYHRTSADRKLFAVPNIHVIAQQARIGLMHAENTISEYPGKVREYVGDLADEFLDSEHPEYKQSGQKLVATILSEGAVLRDTSSGMAIRKVCVQKGQTNSELVAFNPNLSQSQLASLGRVDMPGGELRASAPSRQLQATSLEQDPAKSVRKAKRTRIHTIASAATGTGAGVLTSIGVDSFQDFLQKVAETTFGLDIYGGYAEIVSPAVTYGAAAYAGAMVMKDTFKSRIVRGAGKYTITDLKERTNMAAKAVSEAAESQGIVQIPNNLVAIAISSEESYRMGLTDQAGKLKDMQTNRHGLEIEEIEGCGYAMKVRLGDLFTGLMLDTPQPEMRDKWFGRYLNDALTAKQLYADIESAGETVWQEWEIYRLTGINRSGVESAQAEAAKHHTRLAEFVTTMVRTEQFNRFQAAVDNLLNPPQVNNATKNPSQIDGFGLRDVISRAAVAALPPDSHGSVKKVDELSYRLSQLLGAAKNNIHLEHIYTALTHEYEELQLPDWHLVGHQIAR